MYSQGREEHEQHLRIVLHILREHKLFTKFKKCEFWLDRVSLFGHVVSKDEISIDSSKVKVVVHWKKPTNITEVGIL